MLFYRKWFLQREWLTKKFHKWGLLKEGTLFRKLDTYLTAVWRDTWWLVSDQVEYRTLPESRGLDSQVGVRKFHTSYTSHDNSMVKDWRLSVILSEKASGTSTGVRAGLKNRQEDGQLAWSFHFCHILRSDCEWHSQRADSKGEHLPMTWAVSINMKVKPMLQSHAWCMVVTLVKCCREVSLTVLLAQLSAPRFVFSYPI